ncbi:uncharacterized protein LOC100643691 isoform X2 [Bombus terrestris]|uniref:Uncharacterized protein LOC100643691 isoform X2 n=1 Tax=Bombus terrestris TaxID=30195 RepID=A0A9B7CW74_BOMTE|nr:uncharacterized protein LOC100643691 isoform X2 [Bombus terrestris]
MKLLEEYQELVERDSVEISCLWKYLQMFLYLLCAISGYASSVLFYTLWEQIFGGNCPLWAKAILLKEDIKLDDIHGVCKINSDWWKYIYIDYRYENICVVYLITSFSSCIFGIVWFILFLMCGKGGYDVTIYPGPWRIVFPAIYFNLVFTIISIYTHYNLQQGYKTLSKNIKNISSEIYDMCQIIVDVSDCEIIRIYMNIYNFYTHNLDYMCNIILYLQVPSVVMMCSWIGGLVILIFRIIMINDFRILRIKIYELKEE